MAKSSAGDIFTSAAGAGTLGIAGVVGSMAHGMGSDAAQSDLDRADEALKTAAGLKTTADSTGTNATTGTSDQTSTVTFAPKTTEEQALLDASIKSYEDQTRLVDDQEAGITGRLGTQGQARDALGNILGGQAFDLTPSEMARIEALRGADISASSNAVNQLLTERLGETAADAQRRGLRGQAYTQLQGDAIGQAARELNTATLDANRTAAGHALSMPGQRVGIQAGTAGAFADFADAARQQAIQNRGTLQDPVALAALRDERLKGGTTTNTGTTTQTGTTAGQQVDTGGGQAAILAAGLDKPSADAGGLATLLEVGGLAAKGAGSV